MKTIHDAKTLNAYLNKLPKEKTVGFIPTMGALHNGHLSLLNQAKGSDDIVICSIFVNPTQFNESSDYEKYPQVLDADIELLKTINIDIVFAPAVSEIYPNGTDTIPTYDIGILDHILEGEHRPGHFQGVCHIIDVFLNMIQPHNIYMGEKDIQQIAVVQKLIEINKHKTNLVPCSTLREESGLAMSSRNRLLSESGTEKAATFNKALCHIRDNARNSSFEKLKKEANQMMIAVGFTPEYIALCETKSLEELIDFDHTKIMRLIGAAFIEDVRLIDNIAV